MGGVGSAVQAVLGENSGVSFDPNLASAVGRLVLHSQQSLLAPLTSLFGSRTGEALSWAVPVCRGLVAVRTRQDHHCSDGNGHHKIWSASL
jgi:hypothetical protein